MHNAPPLRVIEALAEIDAARGALTRALCRLTLSEGKAGVQIAHGAATEVQDGILALFGMDRDDLRPADRVAAVMEVVL